MTPFGNITTDPRLVHLTGEKLIFSCHNGDDDKKLKTAAEEEEGGNPFIKSDDNNDEPPSSSSLPEPKPVRQLIIISGGSPLNKINNDGKDMKPMNEQKNNGPSPINMLNRNKRQALFEKKDPLKKECACKCAC